MYENGGVQEPAVIWDEDERKFRMWYTGHTRDTVTYTYNGQKLTRAVRIRQTGYATSSDGISWLKYAGNPVFQPMRETGWEEWFAVDHPAILKDPRKGYHLFYFSWYSIGHAFSEDGITWTRNAANPLLRYKQNADSTVVMYGGPCAFIKDSTLYLYYMRSIPGSKKWGEKGMCIGLATIRI